MNRIKNFLDNLASNKDFLYIIQPFSIGDFIYAGGLAHAVQKRKNKKAAVLVVQERMKNLGITYPNFAGIIYLPNDAMNVLKQYFYATGDYEGDNYIYGHFHTNKGDNYIWDDTLHLIDRYKKNVFNIPLDTKFIAPIVPAISEENIAALNDKYIFDRVRTIILIPYVHSTKQIDINFWEILAEILKESGYIVYTNTDGFSEKPVAGTDAITTSFLELNFIADKIKCFIGSRNGIFDFLAFKKAVAININPFPSWLWDVELMYPNNNSKTFYNAIDYVKPVKDYFRKDNVAAVIDLSHPHIKTEAIFYSYAEALNKILAYIEKI